MSSPFTIHSYFTFHFHLVLPGSYHKGQIANPPKPRTSMFKTTFQIRQHRYQPNEPLTLAVIIIGAYMGTGG